MRVRSITVNNYRSITKANKLVLANETILVGKNNEGKSNLLMAINVAMSLLEGFANSDQIRYSRHIREIYDWKRDFPIALQNSRKKTKYSEFVMEFSLDTDELEDFRNDIGNSLNGSLPISIQIGMEEKPSFKVIKKGKGSKSLNLKSSKVAKYIAKNIRFNYVPAVRTGSDAEDEIGNLLSEAMSELEQNQDYINAMNTIMGLRRPIVEKLSKDVESLIRDFVPSIKEVGIEYEERKRYRSYYLPSIIIDDGIKTDLQHKGDGIKSLVSLALILNSHKPETGMSILAIEEPESHLHPEAVSRLRYTISQLAQKSQVIISTHNPIFVNREKPSSNIIVSKGVARQAKNMREIRSELGVSLSDNLCDANVILYVEGETDAIALRAIMSSKSTKISDALQEHTLVIQSLGGVKNLNAQLSFSTVLLCKTVVFVDNDSPARAALTQAKNSGMINESDCIYCVCHGEKDAEIEDMYEEGLYDKYIEEEYGISLRTSDFLRKDDKWSNRLKKTFEACGKIWSHEVEQRIKYLVAENVRKNPQDAIKGQFELLINSLVKRIEGKL